MAFHSKNLQEQIDVMKGFENGEAVEASSELDATWASVRRPTWNWHVCDYRIKPRPPISRKDLRSDINDQLGEMSNDCLAATHREHCGSDVYYDTSHSRFYVD